METVNCNQHLRPLGESDMAEEYSENTSVRGNRQEISVEIHPSVEEKTQQREECSSVELQAEPLETEEKVRNCEIDTGLGTGEQAVEK